MTTGPPSGPPLAGPYAAPAGYLPTGSYSPPPTPRRRRRRLWLIILVVGVVVIVATLAYAYLASPQVQVTGVNFVSPDNACGLDGATDNEGFNATPGSSYQLTYDIPNNLTSPCTIANVTTNTAGFSVTGANVPLTIPGNASQLLSFSVNVPSSSFVGVLTLIVT